jgi:peroxiredoxin
MSDAALTISEQADAIKTSSAGRLPAEVAAVFDAQAAGLRDAGVPEGVAATGTVVSDAALLDAHGGATTLYEVTAGRPAVVVFYRGAWCPYCNVALHTYSEQLLKPLAEHGVQLVAVSPQRPDGSLSMQEKHDLAFGVLTTSASQEVLAAQRRLGLDLTEVNADGTAGLPMPTVVLIDADHRIRWIDVHPDYTTRTEVAEILDAVHRSLQPARA